MMKLVLICAAALALANAQTSVTPGIISVPLTHKPKSITQMKAMSVRRADHFEAIQANIQANPSIPLTDIQDSEYFGEVDIGTPAQVCAYSPLYLTQLCLLRSTLTEIRLI